MNTKFYKMRRNRMISGVLAGLSDKWNLDVTLVRFLFAIFTTKKEDIEAEMYGTGPRKIKEAEPIKDDEGWFW